MTPEELYNMEPIKVTKDITILKGFNYDHIPELNLVYGDIEKISAVNKRIEIKYLGEHHFDPRRSWVLASVWHDGFPVMIIQNAGRELDDYSDRFITDNDMYSDMLDYLYHLRPVPNFKLDEKTIYKLNDDIKHLDNFYGYKLKNIRKGVVIP